MVSCLSAVGPKFPLFEVNEVYLPTPQISTYLIWWWHFVRGEIYAIAVVEARDSVESLTRENVLPLNRHITLRFA